MMTLDTMTLSIMTPSMKTLSMTKTNSDERCILAYCTVCQYAKRSIKLTSLIHHTVTLNIMTLSIMTPIEWPLDSVFSNKYDKIRCWLRNYEYLWQFTNSCIPVCHWYATIHFYLVYFEYLLVYRYSDSLPTNTNK